MKNFSKQFSNTSAIQTISECINEKRPITQYFKETKSLFPIFFCNLNEKKRSLRTIYNLNKLLNTNKPQIQLYF